MLSGGSCGCTSRPRSRSQIGLATGEFRSGRYVRGNDWDDNWTRDEA